jgi:hypothetical protein
LWQTLRRERPKAGFAIFAIQSAAAKLSFRNNYNMDTNFDGGVLEISLNEGSFTDILAAGGSFVQNGYNGSITIGELNPLDGRSVWTGNSNGYLTTIVNLPASAAGMRRRDRPIPFSPYET